MTSLHLRRILTKAGEAYLLPVPKFPIEPANLPPVQKWLHELCVQTRTAFGVSSEVFLQLEQLRGKECRELFADHGKQWMPETGLGVWVDREPPQKWTQEELDNATPEKGLRPLMFQVYRVSTAQQFRDSARAKMMRYGSIVELLTTEGDKYLPKVRPIFSERIVDRIYSSFPFYVPLMEAKTVAAAEPDQFARWFTGMKVYIRQSFEDKGILIASAVPLGELLKRMGGTLDNSDWVFEV